MHSLFDGSVPRRSVLAVRDRVWRIRLFDSSRTPLGKPCRDRAFGIEPDTRARPTSPLVAALPDPEDRNMKIAKIVSSNSHIDYIARVIDTLDTGETPPHVSDYCFGQ